MPDFRLVTRIHVLSAIREYDQLGADAFLSKYGFGATGDYRLRHRGKPYDAKAILGVAHRYATGTAARSEEFSGGKDGAAKVLEKLEFEVVHVDPDQKSPATSRARTSSPRSATPKKPPARPAKPEPVVTLCPKCFTQVPASGICDYCD